MEVDKQLKFKSHESMQVGFISNNVDVMIHDCLSSVALVIAQRSACFYHELNSNSWCLYFEGSPCRHKQKQTLDDLSLLILLSFGGMKKLVWRWPKREELLRNGFFSKVLLFLATSYQLLQR